MSLSSRAAARLLDQDERDLVARSDKEGLARADLGELRTLQRTLRERRNRARSAASRQRREMRGKAAPKGARPAADNVGSLGKLDVLTGAIKRVSKEVTRRQAPRESQGAIARRALAMKQAAAPASTQPDDRTASDGMQPIPNTDQAPSGALDHAGARPAMMRAGVSR